MVPDGLCFFSLAITAVPGVGAFDSNLSMCQKKAGGGVKLAVLVG